jgi:hypothetical protein
LRVGFAAPAVVAIVVQMLFIYAIVRIGNAMRERRPPGQLAGARANAGMTSRP